MKFWQKIVGVGKGLLYAAALSSVAVCWYVPRGVAAASIETSPAVPDAPRFEESPVKPAGRVSAGKVPEKKPAIKSVMTRIQQAIRNEDQKQRFLDVIIIADHDKQSNPFAEHYTLVALWQEAAPIIVSREIWVRIIKKNTENKDPLYAGILFDRFAVYQGTVGQEWFLIIPKAYHERLTNNNKEAQKNPEQLLGFKIKSPDILSPRADHQVMIGSVLHTVSASPSVPAFADTMNKESVDNLLLFFTPKQPELSKSKEEKKEAAAPSDGLWNIILTGHGSYPSNLDEVLTKQGVFAQKAGGVHIAGLVLPLFRHMLDFVNARLHVNTFYLTTCYGGDYNLQLPYMPLLLEEKWIMPVDEKSSTKKAYQVIENQADAAKTPLAAKRLLVRSGSTYNFTIAVGALTSKVAQGVETWFITASQRARLTNIETLPDLAFSVARYFYGLRLHGAVDKNSFLQPAKYTTEQLAEVLRDITVRYTNKVEGPDAYSVLDPYGISSLPSIKLPGWDKFYPLQLDEKIEILTPQRIAKHQVMQKIKTGAEGQGSLVINKNAEAVLFCASLLPIEIKIESDDLALPSFVSMLPGEVLHTIETIKTQLDLSGFKKLFTIFPVFSKYFYIKKLYLGTQLIENVLVYIKRNEATKKNEYKIGYEINDGEEGTCYTSDGINIVFMDFNPGLDRVNTIADARAIFSIMNEFLEHASKQETSEKTLVDSIKKKSATVQASAQKNYKDDEAIKLATEGMKSFKLETRASALNLFKLLVAKENGYDEALKAAIEGMKSPDYAVQRNALLVFKNLVDKGKGEVEAAAAASVGIMRPGGGVRGFARAVFKTLLERGKGITEAQRVLPDITDDATKKVITDGLNKALSATKLEKKPEAKSAVPAV